MSSFPQPITAPQQTTLRTSGYWSRVLACFSPSTVIFQAEVDEDIDTPFLEFAYTNVTVGSEANAWAGMVFYITDTTSLRNPIYRGRVRVAPSGGTFYCDECAILLEAGQLVTVCRDVDLFAKTRRDLLVDGYLTYQPPEPAIEGLPGVVVLYDQANTSAVTWTPAQTGVPVAYGATINDVTGWAWAISGDGSTAYTSGSSSSQHPTIQFEAGFMYLVRCSLVDSNAVTHIQFVRVYCVTRTFTAPAKTAVVAGTVTHDLDNGFTADLTGYADLTTLLDRTECVIWHIQRFGDNSSTPPVTNILATGRIRSSSIQTEGSTEAGQVQQVTFTLEGIAAYTQRLRTPPDIVRPASSSSAWGELSHPTPYRAMMYYIQIYSTLSNLYSIEAGSNHFAAWEFGADPVGIDGGFLSDVITNLFHERLRAALNYAPDGTIRIEQTASYRQDRSGIDLIMTYGLVDLRSFTANRDSSQITAQVVAYGGMYSSTFNQMILTMSQSPTIVYGDAPETKEMTRVLLQTDSTAAEAEAELGNMSGCEWAAENPKTLFTVLFYDSYAWLIATNYQRHSFNVPASANTLGIPYTATDYFQLQSVSIGINADGSLEVSGEFYEETSFDDAQQLNALLPINNENLNPVLPVLPNDIAFPIDPLELYPSDTPGIDDLQPIDNFSAGQSYMPFPPNIAQEATETQGKPKCFPVAVNFRNPSNTTSSKTTQLGDDYLLTLQGFSTYSTGSWQQTFNFVGGNANGWTARTIGAGFGATFAAAGVEPINNTTGGQNHKAVSIGRDIPVMTEITEISVLFDFVRGTYVDTSFGAYDIGEFDPIVSLEFVAFSATVTGNDQTLTWNGSLTTDKNISVFIRSSRYSGVPDGNVLVKSVTMRGSGDNPFTGEVGTDLSCDAFYTYDPSDAQGVTAQLYGTSEGVRLDNAAVSAALIPPFNPSHRYVIPFSGTNSLLLARMAFNSYTDKQNRSLLIEVCPVQT